jgi:MYXO-CTERM domain-containing protein
MPEMLLSGMTRGLLILVCFALLAQPAVGQDRTPTPSGEELWKTYPLHPSPTPGAASTAVPSPTAARTEKRRSGTSPDRSDSSPTAGLVVIALAAVLVVLAVVLLRRRRTAVQDSKDPAPQSPPEAADQAPQADPDPSGSPPTTPPDPLRPWTATIQWRHADAESRFCVVAEPAQGHGETVLATSEPLEWPPTTPASVQALTDATEKLAAALASVGWQELPHTGEWYAKRFAWEPEPSAPRSESGRYAEQVVR